MTITRQYDVCGSSVFCRGASILIPEGVDYNMSDSKDNVKRLYLSSENKQLSGVCGGISEYFNLDPTIVRLGWVLVTLVTGIVPGIVAYIIAAAVMPTKVNK